LWREPHKWGAEETLIGPQGLSDRVAAAAWKPSAAASRLRVPSFSAYPHGEILGFGRKIFLSFEGDR
jgi:hypothetical protein